METIYDVPALTTASPDRDVDNSLNPQRSVHHEYTSRKPTWWKKRSGKASKGQRRVMALLQEQYNIAKLPYGASLSWDVLFPTVSSHDREIWIEIGFGLGDNLLCLAAQSSPSSPVPDEFGDTATVNAASTSTTVAFSSKSRCLVGAEIHSGGLGTLYTRIQSAVDEGRPWQGFTLWEEHHNDQRATTHDNHRLHEKGTEVLKINGTQCATIGNGSIGGTSSAGERVATTHRNNDTTPDPTLYNHLRVYAGDGTKLLPSIPDASVAVVILAFPDPFMAGLREQQWRLLQVSVLAELRRILHGRLFLATDHEGYHAWCHTQVDAFNQMQDKRQVAAETLNNDTAPTLYRRFTPVEPVPHRSVWLPVVSKYEQKGWDEGRSTHLSCWQ